MTITTRLLLTACLALPFLAACKKEEAPQKVEQAPLTEVQRQEVDRRLAAHRANPAAAVPWEQVEAEALARLVTHQSCERRRI